MPPATGELGIDRLTIEERLALAEEIWASVTSEVEDGLLTNAQRQELNRRLADSIVRPQAVTAWKDVKSQAILRIR